MIDGLSIELSEDGLERQAVCLRLITALSDQFGEAAVDATYVQGAYDQEGIVARVDGEPVGLLLFRVHLGQTFEIAWVGVDPAYQRGGIARQMTELLFENAAHSGVRHVVMNLPFGQDDDVSAMAQAFAENLGFTQLMTVTSPEGFERVLMLLELEPVYPNFGGGTDEEEESDPSCEDPGLEL